MNENENSIINIKSNIVRISEYAFAGKNIKSITFEADNSIAFADSSFAGSTIQSITFPSKTSSIASNCFQYCNKLTTVDLSLTQLTTIPDNFFMYCTNLKTVKLPGTIQTVSKYSFYGCNLDSINIEDTQCVSISDYSFSQTSLTSITLPITVKSIGTFSFSESEIYTFSFPSSNNDVVIGKYCFSSCSNLKHVTLPNRIQTLPEFCFSHCESLLEITLPSNALDIQMNCFEFCTSLRNVTIPQDSKLDVIYPYAFDMCSKFSRFIDMSSKFVFEDGCLMTIDKTKIIYYITSSSRTSIIIPGKVTNIANYAFSGSKRLLEVIIPDGNLVSIGYQAFKDCTNLIRLYLPDNGGNPETTKVDIQEDAFYGCTSLRCGCVRVPESYREEAINKGKISENILNDICVNTICHVSFEHITCKLARKNRIKSAILLTSGITKK